MNLPVFRYHPDPLRSGSVIASPKKCRCCKQARGFIYTGPVYSETDLDDCLCPWCIADGKASQKFDATFMDTEAIAEGAPESAVTEICERTPGYNSWQSGYWPVCCDDATAFLMPAGIAEIRAQCHELEGEIMSHIVHGMEISGGAATRLLNSLQRDASPTLFVFRCLKCERHHFHIDYL